MRRLFFILFLLCISRFGSAQQDSNVTFTQDLMAVHYTENFDLLYSQQLNLIRRTYPLALHAKEIIDSLEFELHGVEKKRLKKKIAKARKKELEEELEYLIKDLYVGEGKMLFKLIDREIGMTVTDILEKYRGPMYAKTIKTTFSLYGHNTSSTFDASGEDWMAELVLQDIEAGRRTIDMRIDGLTKEEYRQNMKDYRSHRKKMRKKKRETRRKKRRDKGAISSANE
jgi:hypothetical protein